jgi:hypothetical protein
METLRDRILHDKAKSAVHTELFDLNLRLEKKRHADRIAALKGRLRKQIQKEIRWIHPEEYFEGELWLPGKLPDNLDQRDFPPCQCTSQNHEMSYKEYWTHRREVNRYRRRLMNTRAERALGEHTCPWKIVGSSI